MQQNRLSKYLPQDFRFAIDFGYPRPQPNLDQAGGQKYRRRLPNAAQLRNCGTVASKNSRHRHAYKSPIRPRLKIDRFLVGTER